MTDAAALASSVVNSPAAIALASPPTAPAMSAAVLPAADRIRQACPCGVASKRIVLIDGEQLTKLMIRHNVGCRVEDTLQIKRIDEDFFE
jgi:hypothetical protein